MTPLLGFAPDVESPTPGVITDCEQFIPYTSGMEAAPSPVTPADVPALLADCRGAAVATKLDGTRRFFAGTAAKLFELSSGTWSDVSRVGDYTGGADTRFSFAQFGDASLVANGVDVIQRSLSGGNFADIAGAPVAEVIFSVGNFVMALNTDFAAHAWHCSALFDDTDWTPAIATQSNRGLLVATPGEMTAGLRLGEYAVAYKYRSMYLGQYVGTPVVWDWLLVSGGEAGCVGKEALCDIDGSHFFVGPDNMWIFDGTRPTPIGNDLTRQWFYDQVNPQSLFKTKCVFDRQQNRVWVFFCAGTSTACDSALVYHVKTGRWGRADRSIEAAVNYISPGVTFDTWDTYGASFDALPNVSYDSQFWLSGGAALSIFNSSHQLQSLTGAPGASSFTTGDAGDDQTVTLLKQVRLRYAAGRGPTSGTATAFNKMNSGDTFTTGATGALNDGKFDLRQSARWHRARFDFIGACRVTGINPVLVSQGQR